MEFDDTRRSCWQKIDHLLWQHFGVQVGFTVESNCIKAKRKLPLMSIYSKAKATSLPLGLFRSNIKEPSCLNFLDTNFYIDTIWNH